MPKKIIGIFTNFRPPPLRQNLKFTKKIALLGERIAQSERTFAGPKWTDVHQCEGKRSAKVGGGQFQFFRKFIFGRSGAHFEWKFEDGTNSKPFRFSGFATAKICDERGEGQNIFCDAIFSKISIWREGRANLEKFAFTFFWKE